MAEAEVRGELPKQLEDDLRRLLGARFSKGSSILELHGADQSGHQPRHPHAVVFPETAEEVARIVEYCIPDRVPLIPYGAGTSVEGHIIAVNGGITVDMSRMNNILHVRPGDLDVTVEAGVTRNAIERCA